MTETVVVLGSGYAGAGAIQRLESELDDGQDLVWVSEKPYHLVLHESHRCIRDPTVQDDITIPIEEIKSPATTFREGRVETIDTGTDGRTVHLADGSTVEYDYLLVAVGSRTAFFGIEGLEEHALTLKSLDDALAIHDAIVEATENASPDDPATVLVGGAGQTGVQVAGEIAAYRDHHDAPIEITLVEGLESVVPGNSRAFRGAIRDRLEERSVRIQTGKFIDDVDAETVHLENGDQLPYDVLVWTGGITGQEEMNDVEIGKDRESNRLRTTTTFQTDHDQVFAIGDAALIDQPGDEPAPATAQAAWQAADVAAENIARTLRGQPLKEWRFEDKGTVVSVGEDAVATNVLYSPIETFGGIGAKVLKKVIATRWIADVSSLSRAVSAWGKM
ncbi:NAD(P)/FAD-dependent oxidoreductase [Halorhabdus sp. CBA1104]|uniref:NAD(P)/FAD-dependent oxidoreductase n=1 Tax=unclassified Halorhabdus TaxID=2621901 RepID=UPI0012B231DD|nr:MULTISPECIES: FAD-dependent oxidoreductase [unclassified Halorhabdus]QGN06545.1 NAD(P)/FAD-dependent oxidoreductase [Halorhabdus sp. CBA1104]